MCVSMARLIARRLVLRKGLALTMGCLALLAVLLLYLSLVSEPEQGNGRTRLVEKPPAPVKVGNSLTAAPLKHNASYNASSPPSHPHHPASPLHFLPLTSPECSFSSIPPAEVDVKTESLFDTLPFDDPDGGVWKQGFDITYSLPSFEHEPLQVFVVPHSHNDPGWLKTFQDYYARQTRSILNYVTDALVADSRRKFIWAEISYLDLWWQEQNEARRKQFKGLVERGQMEIVTGGWVMNDEANTHYFAMIDQLIEGHSWLQENMPGVIPRSGWAIDPFGHTSTMAYLLKQLGLHSMLIQRVHYSVKKHLAKNQQLEFGWRQPWDHKATSEIFCHMMPFYSYDIPHTCGPDPSICCQFDFKRLPGGKVKCPWKHPAQAITPSNVGQRAETLVDQYRKKAQLYRTNVLLVPLGDDFRYDTQKEVEDQFINYQALMDHINSHPNMMTEISFGTLKDYFEAVRAATNTQAGEVPTNLPSLSGDFFTYADRNNHYWSGYYTSRPFYKHLERVLEASLRTAEVLYSLAWAAGGGQVGMGDTREHLRSARRNLGLFQHHDGITGTAKDLVVVDYGRRIRDSISLTNGITAQSVQSLLWPQTRRHDNLVFDLGETYPGHDLLPEQTVLDVRGREGEGEGEGRAVVLVNSLAHSRTQLVHIRVNHHTVTVTKGGNATQCQVNPVWTSSLSLSPDTFDLVFVAEMAPLSMETYFISGTPTNDRGSPCAVARIQFINHSPPTSQVFATEQFAGDDFVLSTERITAVFSGSTGFLQSVIVGGVKVGVAMDFVVYGVTSAKDKSGAYLFLPDGEASSIVTNRQKASVSITVGPLFNEVRSVLDVVTHSVQLLDSPGMDGHCLALANLVDIQPLTNKEVAMRLVTSVENRNGEFFTDLNGFQMVRRQTLSKLALQANFYPMPTMATLQDSAVRVSLLSGQPLGVASLKQGWLEVMLDRRLSQDDGRGLGQGVKDNHPTLEPFRLLLEPRLTEAEALPPLMYPSLAAHHSLDQLLHPPLALLPKHPFPLPPPPSSLSLLHTPLPCDVHLLNLRAIFPSSSPSSSSQANLILHRRGFDCSFYNTPLTCSLTSGKVSVSGLFKGVKVSSVREASLGLLEVGEGQAMETLLPPMEMKAFKLTLDR